MSAPRPALIEDLDGRQDDVIQRLDELNEKVEALLRNWAISEGAADDGNVAVGSAEVVAA